jgi:hypothetical protein
MCAEVNRLKKALKCLVIHTTERAWLARVLSAVLQEQKISFAKLTEIAGSHSEDILLLAVELRLLVPVRTSKSAAWEDRFVLEESGEIYRMPAIVRHLVKHAESTGTWDLRCAVSDLLSEMGEPDYERISELIEKLREDADHGKVDALQIKARCKQLGLEDRIDVVIAELKGGGVMSPKLSSLTENVKAGSPIYELNPCLKTYIE